MSVYATSNNKFFHPLPKISLCSESRHYSPDFVFTFCCCPCFLIFFMFVYYMSYYCWCWCFCATRPVNHESWALTTELSPYPPVHTKHKISGSARSISNVHQITLSAVSYKYPSQIQNILSASRDIHPKYKIHRALSEIFIPSPKTPSAVSDKYSSQAQRH